MINLNKKDSTVNLSKKPPIQLTKESSNSNNSNKTVKANCGYPCVSTMDISESQPIPTPADLLFLIFLPLIILPIIIIGLSTFSEFSSTIEKTQNTVNHIKQSAVVTSAISTSSAISNSEVTGLIQIISYCCQFIGISFGLMGMIQFMSSVVSESPEDKFKAVQKLTVGMICFTLPLFLKVL